MRTRLTASVTDRLDKIATELEKAGRQDMALALKQVSERIIKNMPERYVQDLKPEDKKFVEKMKKKESHITSLDRIATELESVRPDIAMALDRVSDSIEGKIKPEDLKILKDNKELLEELNGKSVDVDQKSFLFSGGSRPESALYLNPFKNSYLSKAEISYALKEDKWIARIKEKVSEHPDHPGSHAFSKAGTLKEVLDWVKKEGLELSGYYRGKGKIRKSAVNSDIAFIPNSAMSEHLAVSRDKALSQLKSKSGASDVEYHKGNCTCPDKKDVGELYHVVLKNPKVDIDHVRKEWSNSFAKGPSVWSVGNYQK